MDLVAPYQTPNNKRFLNFLPPSPLEVSLLAVFNGYSQNQCTECRLHLCDLKTQTFLAQERTE